MEPSQPQLPVSFSRTASNGSSFDNMQLVSSAVGSFDGRPPSFSGSITSSANPIMYTNPQQSAMIHQAGYRSFSEATGPPQQAMDQRPQIYTAVYSGVSVYEMEINGVAVMRRRSDSWLNATQILKVAGVDKGKRTKVIEKEILTGPHEKVQGGYGKYQGTWVPYSRGREHCRQYGVEDLLRPLLDYDVGADGTGVPGQGIETPTKEQAMAANRKRFYAAGLDHRNANQNSNGTFFSNISTTASNAIAAMNRVARLNSPAPRPPSSQRRTGNHLARSSQPSNSQESQPHASQQSLQSVGSNRSFSVAGPHDSTYGTQGQFYTTNQSDGRLGDGQEPPRKRMRPSSADPSLTLVNGASDAFMRDGTPTEPNESFVYHQAGHSTNGDGAVLATLPPLPPPKTKLARDKQALMLDLFLNTSRTSDVASHPVMHHLSGTDFDIPLDQSANTALHWAATLARVPLMRMLISKGANIFRGNIVGHTPLMSAVQVNNSLDHNCFPEMLEILSPLIEIQDDQGRTVLHHIAVTSGIDHRSASSKYYLEALLEFLVRNSSNANSQAASFENGVSYNPKPISLMRFMSEMVNVRDKAGNTALNLAARIGNKKIIQQLLEVQADPKIPNFRGFSPMEFGLSVGHEKAAQTPTIQMSSPSKTKPQVSRVEEASRDLVSTMSTAMSQLETQHATQLRMKQDQIERGYATIRELSAIQKAEEEKIATLRREIRERKERRQQIEKLRRSNAEKREVLLRKGIEPALVQNARHVKPGFADAGMEIPEDMVTTTISDSGTPTRVLDVKPHHQTFLDSLPPVEVLRARLEAYSANNKALRAEADALKSQSSEREVRYRKVVSLCTSVDEDKVDEMLPQLVAAVESETGKVVEASRVKEFLSKLEGVGEP